MDDNPLTSGELTCLLSNTKVAYMCYLEVEKAHTLKESESSQKGTNNITLLESISSYEDIFASPSSLPP